MHAAILTAILFGITGVCATQAARVFGAGRANAWRLLIAITIFTLWIYVFEGSSGYGTTSLFLVAGGLGFGIGGWMMFQALQRSGSTLSLLIVECAAAVFATLIGWLWLQASLTLAEIIFIALILIGVTLGVSPGPIPTMHRRTILVGCLFALFAAMFQAISFNVTKHAFELTQALTGRVSPIHAAYQRLLGGAVVACILYGVTWIGGRRQSAKPPHAGSSSWVPAPVWVVSNAVFGPVLGVSCMVWAISLVHNPGIVQSIAATATLVTVPFARRLENARPGATYYLGCIIALLGTAGLIML